MLAVHLYVQVFPCDIQLNLMFLVFSRCQQHTTDGATVEPAPT